MSFRLLETNFLHKSIGYASPSSPHTIDESLAIKEAVELMKKQNTSCCLVVGQDGKLLGIVSERDIVQKVILENMDLQERVSNIMMKAPKTTTTTATVASVLNLMANGGYRHVPLVDKDGVPVGLISVRNIVAFITKQLSLAEK